MTTLDDVVGAQDKLVVFMASLLQRAGVTQMGEFDDLLGGSAEAVAAIDPEEAILLSSWPDSIRGPHGH